VLDDGKAAMRVERFRGTPYKVRKVVALEHFSPPINFIVHNSSITNLEKAILERIYFVKGPSGKFQPPPLPEKKHFDDTMQRFSVRLRKFLPRSAPIERNKFADLYCGRLKDAYAKAAASLYVRDIGPKDAIVDAFVKAEKINATAKSDPVPRVIQPRSKRYGVELGRFIKPNEKRICKAVDQTFNADPHTPTIFKGMNASESGRAMFLKWSRFRRPVAVGLDAKRFDQHVSVVALEWEHRQYLNCFNNKLHKRKLGFLLSFQLDTVGYGNCKDGKIKYFKTGGRNSGDMNTGLGNCLIMCGLVYSYMLEKKIEFELANNGDDCVVIMEQSDLPSFSFGLSEWFTAMGFSMTVEAPVYELEKIEFCQTHPVFDGSGYVMVRNITSIAKDCISLVYNDTINSLYSYYRVLGDAGLHLTGGIPVWQNFYRALCRSIPPGSRNHHMQHESGMMNLALRMNRNFSPPTDSARHSFYQAFGISPDQQIDLEKHYDGLEVGWSDLKSTLSRDFITFFPT
jgi:hypothetical protein